MAERSKFAGGDQTYLRDRQYATGDKLAARAALHNRFRTGPVAWLDWVHDHLGLAGGDHVLECGCGTGWLWTDSARPIPPGIHLTLTDLSPGMVGEATARIEAREHVEFAGVTGIPADLQQLPFEDDAFDVVIANHMLYHLPEPSRGVAELARVVRDDGRVVAATNGTRHMRELWQLRAAVFGTPVLDQTLDVFSAEAGFPYLRDRFDVVTWHRHTDELRCTDPAAVLAFICSTPPGEDASPDEAAELSRLIDACFAEGDGVMMITKDSGCFVCTGPL
ncbi:MAG: putative methyltransferase [Ilumatobacteraceae bacterium]|nr:putative methyltransferase [Ilumatobacteraceae bacterium]